jgi:hypothetical protein
MPGLSAFRTLGQTTRVIIGAVVRPGQEAAQHGDSGFSAPSRQHHGLPLTSFRSI